MFREIVTDLGKPDIDAKSGVIRSLPLIAEGEIKWNQGRVDKAGLKSYLDDALKRFGSYGVPIMWNPDGYDHGLGPHVGNLVDLHIGTTPAGTPAVLGTFKALSLYPERGRMFESLLSQARAIGLSVEAWEHQVDGAGKPVNGTVTGNSRCDELMCAKFVMTPAATPGLFAARYGTREAAKNYIDATHKALQSPYLTLAAKKPPTNYYKKIR